MSFQNFVEKIKLKKKQNKQESLAIEIIDSNNQDDAQCHWVRTRLGDSYTLFIRLKTNNIWENER